MKSLLITVLAHANLTAAWRRVWENAGGPGGDGVTVEQFGARALAEIAALKREVSGGTYRPGLLREIELPRQGREPRLLCVPCVRDRVLQTSAALVLSPILDRLMAPESHAYRPGHSVAGALTQVIEARREGFGWVVDGDISDYFDSIPHDLLLRRLGEALPDASPLSLFELWLKAPAAVGLTIRQRSGGLPQGAPISPLLSNLFLSRFDAGIRDGNRRYVRYADDFVILCRSYDDAEVALETADALLRGEGLELNFAKTRICSFADGFDFLGVHFLGGEQAAIIPEAGRWLLPKAEREVPGLPHEAAGAPLPRDEAPVALRPLLNTVHVAERGACLRLDGGRLLVSREDRELFEIPLEKLDQICVAQEGMISFGAMRALLSRRIGFVLTSGAGEPVGWLEDLSGGNAALHRAQFMKAEDSAFRLRAAAEFVSGKVRNARLILRRYGRFKPDADQAADQEFAMLGRRLQQAGSLDVLMGLEGAAARRYFSALGRLLGESWNFTKRNRRPPRDPVNVLLSYGYAILFQNVLTLAVRRGLHPHVGSLHTTTGRHPALISDLMEEFRPLVVDAVVLKLLLNGRIRPEHFDYDQGEYPCRLLSAGRRIFIQAMEAKFDAPLKHPHTGADIDLRRAIAAQVQQWAEVVGGKARRYRAFVLH